MVILQRQRCRSNDILNFERRNRSKPSQAPIWTHGEGVYVGEYLGGGGSYIVRKIGGRSSFRAIHRHVSRRGVVVKSPKWTVGAPMQSRRYEEIAVINSRPGLIVGLPLPRMPLFQVRGYDDGVTNVFQIRDDGTNLTGLIGRPEKGLRSSSPYGSRGHEDAANPLTP